MKSVVIGQYVPGNSWIHKLDARTKIISLMLLIIATLLVGEFTTLAVFLGVTILVLMSSGISLMRFIKGMRPVIFLLFFTFIFQVLMNREGAILFQSPMELSWITLGISIAVFLFYMFTKKYIKYRFLYFLITFSVLIWIQMNVRINAPLWQYNIAVYEAGLFRAGYILMRIFILISLSSLLTLTTKPNDLNNGLDVLLKPFSKIGLPSSELSMMISISLRFIPTLLDEANKIIKAQASRGVDFQEGTFKDKITQIISLLIPMFIISFKRADDLANAMEARGYVPGANRSRLYKLEFKYYDYVTMVVCLILNVTLLYFGF